MQGVSSLCRWKNGWKTLISVRFPFWFPNRTRWLSFRSLLEVLIRNRQVVILPNTAAMSNPFRLLECSPPAVNFVGAGHSHIVERSVPNQPVLRFFQKSYASFGRYPGIG